MDPPEYSPQKEWQSNGRAEPSLTRSMVRIPLRRNLRRKVETHRLLADRNLSHSRQWRQRQWQQEVS